jgi:hypothetical protein
MNSFTKTLILNWRWLLAIPALSATPSYLMLGLTVAAVAIHLCVTILYFCLLQRFGSGFVIEGGCVVFLVALLILGAHPIWTRLIHRPRGSPTLPTIAIADVPAPAQLLVKIEQGSNLRSIGAAAYGHERFSGFVAAHNGISNPERITAGTMLKTPSLAEVFRDSGLDPTYQPALNVLAKACADYFETLPNYLRERRGSVIEAGKFQISPEIEAKFLGYASDIAAALSVLRTVQPTQTVPTKAIAQFEQVNDYIRSLATGAVDDYGYDYDLVGQRFGLAFTNLLIWTQHEHH